MKHLLASLLLFTSLGLSAQDTGRTTPDAVLAAAPFVPIGWKVIATAKGDVNKDAAEDIAIVIENTDKANIIANTEEDALPKTFNINPRHLLILFKNTTDEGYTLGASNESFIPPQDDPEIPCLVDPFIDAGGIAVKNGTLQVILQTFMSCGGWAMDTNIYTLRYQEDEFVLIGYDSHSGNRATGELYEVSINYLTKKKSTTEGENMFDENASHPKTTREKITVKKLLTLSELTYDTEIEY